MENLKFRLLNLHESSYLALVSIVQGAVFGFLCISFFAPENPVSVWTIERTILGLTTLLLVIIVWNEYVMGVAIFKWIPNIFDASIPFLLGAAQTAIISNLNDFRLWCWSFACFFIIGLISYINMYVKAGKEKLNEDILNALGWYKTLSIGAMIGYLTIFLLLAIILPLQENINAILPLCPLILMLLFYVRTVFYWNRIKSYACSE